MPKAHEVAVELRKFADLLDKNPDVNMSRPDVSFYHWGKSDKGFFFDTCKLLPRPLKKRTSYDRLYVEYATDIITVYASIPQSETCQLVEPAKPAVYRCDSILSPEEDAAMEESL